MVLSAGCYLLWINNAEYVNNCEEYVSLAFGEIKVKVIVTQECEQLEYIQ